MNQETKVVSATDKPAHPALAAHRRSGAREPSPHGIRCSQPQCETELDPGTGKDETFRRQFAITHGFVEANGKLFCSRRCCAIEMNSPSGTAGETSPGGLPMVMPKAGAKGALLVAEHIVTVTTTNADGTGTTTWLGCPYPACATRIEVPKGLDVVKIAAAHGFVEKDGRVYCGGTCHRKHLAELAQNVTRETPKVATTASIAGVQTLEKYQALVSAVAKELGQDGIELLQNHATRSAVALVDRSGSPRIVAYEADTLEGSCAHALSKLKDFLDGTVGGAMSPFTTVVPVRVGSVNR